jgi:aminocarboxymuconate-semialdehyde decarboxylase
MEDNLETVQRERVKMRIDVHAHFVPRGVFNTPGKPLDRYRPSLAVLPSGEEIMPIGAQPGPAGKKVYDPEIRIQDMRTSKIDVQVISPLASNYYAAPVELALKMCREENDYIAGVVRAYPDKFVGLATIPMQDASAAVGEMMRAVKELGLKGIQINSNINGKNPGEAEFFPTYEAAEQLNVPISVHPFMVAGADRMQKYYLTNLVGNPIDTTIAIASIIFGGVLERFPGIKFLFAHAGGCIPYIKGRLERGYEVIPECREAIPHPPGYYLSRVYFDTVTHSREALEYLVKTHSPDKIVMGDPDPVHTVDSLNIPLEARENILWRNASSLFDLSDTI